MARSLSPQVICDTHTSAEIDIEVTFWKDQLKRASVRSYDKDSTQGRQKVEAAELKDISATLQVYLKAKQLCLGLGKPHIISVNFRSRGF